MCSKVLPDKPKFPSSYEWVLVDEIEFDSGIKFDNYSDGCSIDFKVIKLLFDYILQKIDEFVDFSVDISYDNETREYKAAIYGKKLLSKDEFSKRIDEYNNKMKVYKDILNKLFKEVGND